jgi:hypothetical protein
MSQFSKVGTTINYSGSYCSIIRQKTILLDFGPEKIRHSHWWIELKSASPISWTILTCPLVVLNKKKWSVI